MELNFEKAVDYHYGEFPPSNLNFGDFVSPLVSSTDALARYDQMLKSLHNSEILLAPLRNQEAVISSRMEGTISTLDEILRYEADSDVNIGDHERVRSDIIETVLYSRALKSAQHALEKGYPFSESMIKSIHEQLLSYGRGSSKSPGEYKKEQNYLADKLRKNVSFIPISPERLPDGMETLLSYIDGSQHPPIIKAALAHLEFEALHPFLDGNGRIGRMLITLMLWQSRLLSEPHFYISSYFEENKEEYIDSMREVSRTGKWEKWCIFFLEAVEEQANRKLHIAETISDLYESMKTEFSDVLSSKYSIQALDFVFSNPVFRNNKFTQQSGIPRSTAARFTRILVENDLLKTVEEAAGRRPALYSFEPLMELVRV